MIERIYEETNSGKLIPKTELVRFEHCVNNDINCGGEDNWCLYFGHDVYDDDFCSYGEEISNE